MGPLVSRSQQQKVLSFIDIGRQEGAEFVLGGNIPEGYEAAPMWRRLCLASE